MGNNPQRNLVQRGEECPEVTIADYDRPLQDAGGHELSKRWSPGFQFGYQVCFLDTSGRQL